jgi:putative transposase
LLTPHSIYTRLGINEKERQLAYRGLFAQQIEGKLLEDIRQATNKGLALGNEHFLADIESHTGRRVIERKRGRPVGWRKNKSEVKALN